MHAGNVQTLHIGEIYRVCQYLFCTGQATHSLVLVGQVVIERHWKEKRG
jgi:hypothetical protein